MRNLAYAFVMLAFLNGCATEGRAQRADRTPSTHPSVSPVEKPLFGGEDHTGVNTTEDRISTPTS